MEEARIILFFFGFLNINFKYTYMENPFEIIMERLNSIENQLKEVLQSTTIRSVKNVPELLTLPQLSDYIGLAKQTIYKYSYSKTIPHYKTGKKLVFKKEEIDEWLKTFKIKTIEDLEREATKYLIKKRFRK